METIWKVVPFASAYEASNDGQIRRIKTGRKMTPVLNYAGGYYIVCTSMAGKIANLRVHRMVAAAFLGDSDMEVNHKNGDKLDNRIENLEFVTRKQNAEHAAHKIKTYRRGSGVPSSRLTEADIPKIWAMRERGDLLADIAQAFGVSVGCICFVLDGGSWRKESEALGKLEPRST